MSQEEFPVPSEITRADRHDILIKWRDGHETLFLARQLRLACPCAGCVDEITGARRLDATKIPDDVHPLTIQPVGGYAITIAWSDGHRTGIYAFSLLRKLCSCPKCQPPSEPAPS